MGVCGSQNEGLVTMATAFIGECDLRVFICLKLDWLQFQQQPLLIDFDFSG